MKWPPAKAWTSKNFIQGQRHFVAINYGGESKERWVILMSVIDSSLLLNVSWSQLIDPSNWKCGWDENNYSDSSDLVNTKTEKINIKYSYPSVDSGLTIPITKNCIRPWFRNI